MTPDELRVEIESGPLAAELAPLVAAGKDAEAAALLNAKTIPTLKRVSRTDFMAWAGQNGVRAMIQDLSVDTTVAVQIRSSALSLMDMLNGGGDTGITLSNSKLMVVVDAWVDAEKLSVVDRNELISLGTFNISRAEEVASGEISASEIGFAVRDRAGNSLMGV